MKFLRFEKWLPGMLLVTSSGLALAEKAVTPTTTSMTLTAPSWGNTGHPSLMLQGMDARQQLLVTVEQSDGSVSGKTREVTFTTEPLGVIKVDAHGLVTPVKDGKTRVTAIAPDGQKASLDITVKDADRERPVNFSNQVVPVFTKFGCNSGGCHGKSEGRNGFRLSLLGFEPEEDFEHLVREARGRRLFPASPERSLLLLKGSGQIPHGGGALIDTDSFDYQLLLRWIRQGMPFGRENDPRLESIAVHPGESVMQPETGQQLVVLARFTDNSTRDITHTAVYEANDRELAEVDNTGYVLVGSQPGEVAVMIRYQDKSTVFRAMVPLGAPVDELPPVANIVDEHIFAKLKKVGMPPSAVCDDATFFRRVTLDIAGRLPTLDEAHQFRADASPDKRAKWIDRLLDSNDYAEYFANKWSALLRNRRTADNQKRGAYAFHDWVRDSLQRNKPYDQFVRQVLAASGEIGRTPPVTWYRQVRTTQAQMEDTAQLFLGTRLQCAQCHHHPFEKWSQEDYYRFSAFFSQVGRENGRQPGSEIIYHKHGIARAKNKKNGQEVKPAGLGGAELSIPAHNDPRHVMVDWMVSDEAALFTKTLVNRYWKHFFGRGMVDPEDDFRATNPPTHPGLLDELSTNFANSGFDIKALVRILCNSTTYQLSSIPNKHNTRDKHYFSRFQPRRLTAEVLHDSIHDILQTHNDFAGMPVGTRAVSLPDNSFNSGSYFLSVFGRPNSSSACECERSQEASLAQSLHLLNAKSIQEKLGKKEGRAAELAANNAKSDEEKIHELYFMAFAREPEQRETQVAVSYLQRPVAKDQKPEEQKKARYEDILWAMINTKEFLFNH